MATYQVLARKYRPQQFSEVVGQDHVVRTLENAIQRKRIAHAYLFVGPRGTGKTTLARIFAKALNCTSAKEPTVHPCDQCAICREITAGTSLDVLEIDGASNNSVEQVRELRETVRYAPAGARFKIIYIDEVHMLSASAFNALLKTLEEPPAHVKFIFATTDPQKIPLTVLSRCQRFDLHRIPNEIIIHQLRKIADLEKVKVSDEALLALARGAVGGLRDAESALDQMIAFCGNKIEEADILSIFGLASQELLQRLNRSILSGDSAAIIEAATSLAAEGKDFGRLLGELIDYYRNVLVIQSGAKVGEGIPQQLKELEADARAIKRVRLLRILEILTEAEGQMKWALSKKICFEVALLKAIETKDEVLLEEVLLKVKEACQNPSPNTATPSAAPAAKKTAPSSAPAVVQENEEAYPSTSADAAPAPNPAMEELWKQLKEEAGKSAPWLRPALVDGFPLAMDVDRLIIAFEREFAIQKESVDQPRSHKWLQTTLRHLTHHAMNAKVVFADESISSPNQSSSGDSGDAANDRPSAGASSSAQFENDPLIHKALEIFKADIIHIKR
jgi:DNA polymerase-3 subunit gamma/tau